MQIGALHVQPERGSRSKVLSCRSNLPSAACSHAGGVWSSLYRALVIVIALIVYGSLYPWDFHSTQLAASPLWVLIHSWPTAIDRFLFRDIAVNVLIYLPVGVFGFLALR